MVDDILDGIVPANISADDEFDPNAVESDDILDGVAEARLDGDELLDEEIDPLLEDEDIV